MQSNQCILVAEDDPFQQKMIEGLLGQLKVQCIMSKNGQEAVDNFSKNCQNIKIILLDLQMPVKDGFQAAKEIKAIQKSKGIKIKMYGLSADDDEDNFDKALDSGMDSIIKKPINKQAIEKIIK